MECVIHIRVGWAKVERPAGLRNWSGQVGLGRPGVFFFFFLHKGPRNDQRLLSFDWVEDVLDNELCDDVHFLLMHKYFKIRLLCKVPLRIHYQAITAIFQTGQNIITNLFP